MRLFLHGALPKEIDVLFTEFGYVFDGPTEDGFAFKRRLHDRKFPRYHLFVREFDGGIELDLHIDQEHPFGKGNHQEEWAYHGQIVQAEIQRLERAIHRVKTQPYQFTLKQKKGFWKILIGR